MLLGDRKLCEMLKHPLKNKFKHKCNPISIQLNFVNLQSTCYKSN